MQSPVCAGRFATWKLWPTSSAKGRCEIRTLALLLSLALTLSSGADACEFDTDCEPGSKCLKSDGQLYGVCVGGISPGNANDRVPVESPLDPNGTVGNTCEFNTDCGPGSQCVKPNGGIYGTCLRSR